MPRLAVLAFSAAAVLAVPALAADHPSPTDLARGRYLVEAVGLCADCHTPMRHDGLPDLTHRLQGAPVAFQPKATGSRWADKAPGIAGLPKGWTAVTLTSFLETGRRPDGKPVRPPMPRYRFSHDDARAVVAYLATLPQR